MLTTPHLVLIPATTALLAAELSNTADLATALNVLIPADWPPGEYDQDAMRYFLDRLGAGGPTAVGWYSWYVVLRGSDSQLDTLVAAGGYFGPPDETGTVEIGYSVSALWRGQGIATELVAALVAHAMQQPIVKRIIAHTESDNAASIRTLTQNRFRPVDSDMPTHLCFTYP